MIPQSSDAMLSSTPMVAQSWGSHLYELAWNRGTVTCEIGDVGQRQRTMQRIRDIVSAPIGLTSLVLVTGLAFAINAVEFLCSAALRQFTLTCFR